MSLQIVNNKQVLTIEVEFDCKMSPNLESHLKQLLRFYLQDHGITPNKVTHGLTFKV